MPTSDQPITIHAARIDRDGDLWIQREPDGRWFGQTGSGSGQGWTEEQLEPRFGPTRPVRIVTTDPPGQFDPPLTGAEKAAFLAADRELNGPAGLSAEQQIRAYAIQATVTWLADEISFDDLYGTAAEFAAWIRDGSMPDAPAS